MYHPEALRACSAKDGGSRGLGRRGNYWKCHAASGALGCVSVARQFDARRSPAPREVAALRCSSAGRRLSHLSGAAVRRVIREWHEGASLPACRRQHLSALVAAASGRAHLAMGLPAGCDFGVHLIFTGAVYYYTRDVSVAAQAGFAIGSQVLQVVAPPGWRLRMRPARC